jgi:ankyrin repeat protein
MVCVVQRGTTALQLAAMWGHLDVCRALLAAGADKNKQSNVSFVKWLSPLQRERPGTSVTAAQPKVFS